MDISVALKLLYYIIVLLPVLMTLKHLLALVYSIKRHEEDYSGHLLGFMWGVVSIVSYGVTVLFINKSMAISSIPMLDKLFYPFVLVLFSMLYTLVIEDKERFAESKIQALLAMPALTGLMFFVDRVLG